MGNAVSEWETFTPRGLIIFIKSFIPYAAQKFHHFTRRTSKTSFRKPYKYRKRGTVWRPTMLSCSSVDLLWHGNDVKCASVNGVTPAGILLCGLENSDVRFYLIQLWITQIEWILQSVILSHSFFSFFFIFDQIIGLNKYVYEFVYDVDKSLIFFRQVGVFFKACWRFVKLIINTWVITNLFWSVVYFKT